MRTLEMESTQLYIQKGPEDDPPPAAEGEDEGEELPQALHHSGGRLHRGLPRRLQRGPQSQEQPAEAGAGTRRPQNKVGCKVT